MKKFDDLMDTKTLGFSGIKANIDPIEDRQSMLKCLNMESSNQPGILTLRPTYQQIYPAPVDARIQNASFVSFDNFYDQAASSGTEITIEVQNAQVVSPGGIVPYSFNSVAIWMRPYFNGVEFIDAWQWLNETTITKLAVGPDSTYSNQMDIQGFNGDLTQWSIINVTKDNTNPAAILYSVQNGTNTTIYTSNYTNNWQAGDVVVLMRNYIPLKYLQAMNAVQQQQISFHRLPSKMRIGFGGQPGRVALSVEYVNRTLQLLPYDYGNIAPALVGKEVNFATCNKFICCPYTQFNEGNQDFIMSITDDTGYGQSVSGTYYFRITAMLEGINELLVLNSSIYCPENNNRFSVRIGVRAGSMLRRLSDVNVYFSSSTVPTALDYYYWKTLNFSQGGNSLNGSVSLESNGYLYNPELTAIMYTENSAVSPNQAASLGSWFTAFNVSTDSNRANLSVEGSSSPYAIRAVPPQNLAQIYMYIPFSALGAPGIQPGQYTLTLDILATQAAQMHASLIAISGGYQCVEIPVGVTWPITTSNVEYTIFITITSDILTQLNNYLLNGYLFLGFAIVVNGATFTVSDYVQMKIFQLSPLPNIYADSSTQFGSLDSAQMGYTPTYNMVKDWLCAVILNATSYVGSAFITQKYGNLIFFSVITSNGSCYDVIPDVNFFNTDQDNFRGESVIGLTALLNSNLLSLTEGGGVIISLQTINTVNISSIAGQITEVARGYGVMTKDSIQKFRDTVYWATGEDIVKIAAQTGYEPVVLSEDSVRGIYNAIPDKTLVSACIDRFASYHMSLGPAAVISELMFTNGKWVEQNRENYPQVLRNGFMLVVFFADPLGNIYSVPQNVVETIGFADLYGKSYKEW